MSVKKKLLEIKGLQTSFQVENKTARAVSGVSDAGLCTILFPAARAGAIFEQVKASGKLNGVIAATTPSGSRRVKILMSCS